ncbi:MAG: SpoIID/LytB domain-containing protein [Crocinitomicaceae bacterium]|nr:SpoIID/LytB domain-containing protein [Crocinitomicaceae bacterium]
MKHLFNILILVFALNVTGQELSVGIMRYYKLTGVKVSHNEGNYRVYGDTSEITGLWADQSIYLKRSGNGVKIEKGGNTLGTFDTVYFRQQKANSSFNIQALSGNKVRKYQDDLVIFADAEGLLTTVNEVNMANYLAGVIESEGGGGKHIEYYKVQAILSRTYALDHLSKHKKEGFSVCDRTHCQAYHSMLRFTPDIRKAVEETKGIIMLDQNLKLADGFFFANCGGQTSESDFVWNVAVPYCRSIADTFCVNSKQANWTTKISKSSWKHYLIEQFGYPVNDSVFGEYLYTFDQPARKAFYIAPQLGIPLRDLRVEFKLKSTWFSCHPEGDQVVLVGKGFGHGVGLCQEGAMNMAKAGYSYEQILHFYFTDIQLFDYFKWLFLKQEEVVGL